ncbi:TetR/AcrR family transcriptional regulator [Kutzneria kofuensis]|uniref:AcrR family transcriptional regulator n=1 Tax=Kutzneria kofuensis TaxID=103725 RepID=A0A7W9KNV5_9PSEU|nr:TetR/AcrR family transcriptional regulator [Kutzneria kofuensis]MBB5895996.1 AcrR family transcriptional regulator [Kutzneria kofuensis]
MNLADLIAERRPHRADARRNFDALVTAATEAYTTLGADVPMDEIARRAGVGIATLYRNFPTRVDLMEHVYLTGIDDLVRYAQGLDRSDPWAALSAWLSRFVTHLATKHVLATVLTRESKVYEPSSEAIYGVADPLFEQAQQAGVVRADVNADDVMRLVFAVTAGIYVDDAQRERAIGIVLDGIRTR